MKQMRLIDIEAINWYDDLFLKGVNHSGVWVRYRDVEKLIRNAPIVDAVPVVRCRECKYWNPYKSHHYKGHFCDVVTLFVQENEYCAWGERKGGDE